MNHQSQITGPNLIDGAIASRFEPLRRAILEQGQVIEAQSYSIQTIATVLQVVRDGTEDGEIDAFTRARDEEWRLKSLPKIPLLRADDGRTIVVCAVDEGEVSTTTTIMVRDDTPEKYRELGGRSFTDAKKGEAVRLAQAAVDQANG